MLCGHVRNHRVERENRESATGRKPARTLAPERQKAPTFVGASSYWRWTQSAANLYRACSRFGRSFSCSEISGERWVHLAGHPLKNKYARAKKGFQVSDPASPPSSGLLDPALIGAPLLHGDCPPSPGPSEAARSPWQLQVMRCRCSSCAPDTARPSPSTG